MTDSTIAALDMRDLGVIAYAEAHAMQHELRAARIAGDIPDTLLLLEHPPVITLGKHHPEPDLAVPRALVEKAGIDIVQAERGGDITYHGPGQLVAYGIIDLRARGLGVTDYVTALEGIAIAMATELGIVADRMAGARGAWVGPRKLASVGVHVSRGVTLHGIAINVDMALDNFDLIHPCGMPGTEMTTLARESGRPVTMADAKAAFERHFRAALSAETCAMRARSSLTRSADDILPT